MAGIKGLKVRQANEHRHRMRTDPSYRRSAPEVPVFTVPIQPWGPQGPQGRRWRVFLRECYERRNTVVIGALGIPMLRPQLFTMEEFCWWKSLGFSVPMDLMPSELWWAGEIPRFGEEALGDDF